MSKERQKIMAIRNVLNTDEFAGGNYEVAVDHKMLGRKTRMLQYDAFKTVCSRCPLDIVNVDIDI